MPTRRSFEQAEKSFQQQSDWEVWAESPWAAEKPEGTSLIELQGNHTHTCVHACARPTSHFPVRRPVRAHELLQSYEVRAALVGWRTLVCGERFLSVTSLETTFISEQEGRAPPVPRPWTLLLPSKLLYWSPVRLQHVYNGGLFPSKLRFHSDQTQQSISGEQFQ